MLFPCARYGLPRCTRLDPLFRSPGRAPCRSSTSRRPAIESVPSARAPAATARVQHAYRPPIVYIGKINKYTAMLQNISVENFKTPNGVNTYKLREYISFIST